MKPEFIAEVSSNHNQDLNRCLRFIDVAAEIGCDGVKFQLFRVDSLFAPEILRMSDKHRKRKDWELPLDYIPKIAAHCRVKNLKFGCTPFYLEAVDALLPYVDFLKIASYEILWNELLARCGDSKKPVILSTGMAEMDEISRAVKTFEMEQCSDFSLLHCVSSYPASINDCNLSAIQVLREKFTCPVGWSDHSSEPSVIFRAVHRWNANIVEFHLDLDSTGSEFSAGHCWLPHQIKEVMTLVRNGFKADGSGSKVPADSEIEDRMWRADPTDGLRPLRELRSKLSR